MEHFFQSFTRPVHPEACPESIEGEAGLTDNEFSSMTFLVDVGAHGVRPPPLFLSDTVPQVTGMADSMQDHREGLFPASSEGGSLVPVRGASPATRKPGWHPHPCRGAWRAPAFQMFLSDTVPQVTGMAEFVQEHRGGIMSRVIRSGSQIP